MEVSQVGGEGFTIVCPSRGCLAFMMTRTSREGTVLEYTSPSDVGGKSYTPDWSEIGWFPRVTFFWGIKFGVNELISFKGDIYILHLLFDHISLYPVYPL